MFNKQLVQKFLFLLKNVFLTQHRGQQIYLFGQIQTNVSMFSSIFNGLDSETLWPLILPKLMKYVLTLPMHLNKHAILPCSVGDENLAERLEDADELACKRRQVVDDQR